MIVQLTFKEHLTHTSEKAGKIVAAVTGMICILDDPKPPSRLLLAIMCTSIPLYAVCTKDLSDKGYKGKLSAVYHLRVVVKSG